MQTIQLEIDERIIQKLGLNAVKAHLDKEIEYLYFESVGKEIRDRIIESGIDNDKELEKAREKQWKQHKKNFLKDPNG